MLGGYEFAYTRDGRHTLVTPRDGWPKGLRDFDLTLDWIALTWNRQKSYGRFHVAALGHAFVVTCETDKKDYFLWERVIFTNALDALRYAKNESMVDPQ